MNTNKNRETEQYSEVTKLTPKSVAPKQNTMAALEQQQRTIMNEIIHLNSTEEAKTQEGNIRNNDNNWKVVQRNKKPNKRYTGQSEDENEKFKKRESPKVWSYLYRVMQEVMEEVNKEYIIKKTGNKDDQFIVKNLKTREGSRFKSYMVAADFKYKDEFYKPSFWPKGVSYRRFDFKLYYERYQIKDVVKDTVEMQSNSFLDPKNYKQ